MMWVEAVAAAGYLSLLEWAWRRRSDMDCWEYVWDSAANYGHIHVLQWAQQKVGNPRSTTSCEAAAGGGQLSALQWLRANGCPWDKVTCETAAEFGYLELLQWARDNGCPWDKRTCANAGKGGHLDVLKWARANGCPWDGKTCNLAAEGGHMEVLQWAKANGCPCTASVCIAAAKGGHLDVLQWARTNGCPWNKRVCKVAAVGGHLDVLKWAKANGCPWDQGTTVNAAFGGYAEVWNWAIANGCPWTFGKCLTTAVRGGHVEVLKAIAAQTSGDALLDAIDYGGLLTDASQNGHWNVIEWAMDLECSIDQKRLIDTAARNGQLEFLQKAMAHGWDGWNHVCQIATKGCFANILQWAHANGCPWDETVCAIAAEYGYSEIFEWAVTNGCPCPPSVLHLIPPHRMEMLRWATEHGCRWDYSMCVLAGEKLAQEYHWQAYNKYSTWTDAVCFDRFTIEDGIIRWEILGANVALTIRMEAGSLKILSVSLEWQPRSGSRGQFVADFNHPSPYHDRQRKFPGRHQQPVVSLWGGVLLH